MATEEVMELNNQGKSLETLFKYDIRIDLLLLLICHPKLNVTEASNLLNRSKATVSRHLRALMKIGLVQRTEVQLKGRINPFYYQIHPVIKRQVEFTKLSIPRDDENRIKFYAINLETMELITMVLIKSLPKLSLIYDYLGEQFEKGELKADRLFRDYLYKKRKVGFNSILINERHLETFYDLYEEFRAKVNRIIRDDEYDEESHTLMFFDAMIPIEDVVRLSAKKNET
jgi:DNA-binding transcriptional ArsR family regulator